MGELAPQEGLSGDVKILETFLDSNPSVEYIRFQWMDYSGLLGARVATKSFALSLRRTDSSITTPSPLLTAMIIDNSLLFEDIEVGQDELFADWSSLKVCHYAPKHAMVMCLVKEGGHKEGQGFLRCPRSRLRWACNSAKQKHDLDFLVGNEVEFCIFDESSGTPKPIDMVAHTYSAASINNKYLPIVEEIVECIQNAGIEVRQFHSEGGPGLFEISTEPMAPLQAADALVYCHETIRNISRKHGLHGTVYPKPFEKLSGLGSHIHLSMSRLDKHENFLAGLLEYWRPLAAFYMPNYDSNLRVRPEERIFWSLHNRTATHRKIKDGHWELRGVDGTANPYLALTAILTAGVIGLEKEKRLTMKDPKRMVFEGMEDDEATDLGILHKMPTSLKAAIDSLKAAEELKDALGPEMIDRYVKVKAKEEENFGKLTGSERRELSMSIF
ncbi:Protein fluG [Lachnellula occidentalis]|uniref:Protein fluG n=1 Tax=Lachnellula occidentalis TaxID=215460 RepID=A0A8H8S523_9HELO|nr:Protein fluG [Lachnellula occidentalis]